MNYQTDTQLNESVARAAAFDPDTHWSYDEDLRGSIYEGPDYVNSDIDAMQLLYYLARTSTDIWMHMEPNGFWTIKVQDLFINKAVEVRTATFSKALCMAVIAKNTPTTEEEGS